MQTRTIGRDGPRTSAIGLGAMSFAGIYGNATQDQAFAIVDACREVGISHIDTSNAYGGGRSEELIGRYLAERGGGDTFSIATKAAITTDADGNRIHRNDREHLESELDKSLKRLGVDKVDLFYVHRRDPDMKVEEMAAGLDAIMATGKAGAVGLSEVAPSTLRRAAAVCPIAAVQSEYSLSSRAPELGLVQACEAVGATLVAFCPVGRGLLTDNPPTEDYIAASGFLKSNPRFAGRNYSQNLAITDGFRALAADMGVPAASLAIAWLLSRGDHVLPIPGTRNPDHLREVAAGSDLALSQEDLARIAEVLPVGWAHGDRYSVAQWNGPERFC